MRKLTADVTQETTNTIGTGTITLDAAAGWARFSDSFAVGDQVDYSIRDGDNWEVGRGTNGASHTLQRTTPKFTVVAGTTNPAPAGPMSLSGSAAVVRAVISQELFSTLLKLEYALKGASFAAADGFAYGITASNVTATLPTGQAGDRIRFFQAAAGVTGFITDPVADKINNTAGAMTADIANFVFSLVYVASYGWVIEP